MSKTKILEQRDEQLVETIKRLEREIDALKTNQSPTFNIGSGATSVLTVTAGSYIGITLTATPATGKLFPIYELSMYKDGTETAANLYPGGSNWNGIRNDMMFEHWLDYDLSDGSNVKLRIIIKNNDASDFDVKVKAGIRYLPYSVVLS